MMPNYTETEVDIQINEMSQNSFDESKRLGTLQPNQIYATPDESDLKSTLPIGAIFTSIVPLQESCYHLLDGSIISGDGAYSQFVSYMAELKTEHNNLFVESESEWNTNKGKFYYNSSTNTIRLPDFRDRFTLAGDLSDIATLGGEAQHTLTVDEMPSHTHTGVFRDYSISSGNITLARSPEHAHDNTYELTNATGGSQPHNNMPPYVKVLYYIVIATVIKTDVEVNVYNLINNLDNKANISGSNLSDLDVESFNERLGASQLVGKYTTTANTDEITMSDINMSTSDGGVYDVIIGGKTSIDMLSSVVLQANVTDITGFNYHVVSVNGTSIDAWQGTETPYAQIGAMSYNQSLVYGTIMINEYRGGNSYMLYNFSSFHNSLNRGTRISSGACKLLFSTVSSICLTVDGGNSFASGTTVKIYKRATNAPTRS